MKGQSCPVRVQRSRINLDNRGSEDVDVVLVRSIAKMPKESVPGSTDVDEVADTDDAFTAVAQLLPACIQPNIIVFVVEFKIAPGADRRRRA